MQLPHRLELRRRRPDGTVDRYGNEVLEVYVVQRVRGRVDPVSSDDLNVDRDGSNTLYNVILRPNGALESFEELAWLDEGITLKAQGDAVPLSDSLRRHHYELVAYRVE